MAANQKLNMKAEAAKTKKMKAQGTTSCGPCPGRPFDASDTRPIGEGHLLPRRLHPQEGWQRGLQQGVLPVGPVRDRRAGRGREAVRPREWDRRMTATCAATQHPATQSPMRVSRALQSDPPPL